MDRLRLCVGYQRYLLGLLDALGPPADFSGGLVEPALDVALPVLVEVRVRHHLVPFRRHLGVSGGRPGLWWQHNIT